MRHAAVQMLNVSREGKEPDLVTAQEDTRLLFGSNQQGRCIDSATGVLPPACQFFPCCQSQHPSHVLPSCFLAPRLFVPCLLFMPHFKRSCLLSPPLIPLLVATSLFHCPPPAPAPLPSQASRCSLPSARRTSSVPPTGLGKCGCLSMCSPSTATTIGR